MWQVCLIISMTIVCVAVFLPKVLNARKEKKGNIRPIYTLVGGLTLAAGVMFFPVYLSQNNTDFLAIVRSCLLSAYNSIRIFTLGTDLNVVTEKISNAPEEIRMIYQVWAACLYILAPIFSFGIVLSLFKNISAYSKYWGSYFKEVYVFSELNEKALVLAEDLLHENSNGIVVFTDVFEDEGEESYELIARAKTLGAICFKKDILTVNFKWHSSKRNMFFFAIGENKSKNLNQALKLIEQYKERQFVNLYIFADSMESELRLTAVDKGLIKVRRINEVRSLINRELYENGSRLFTNALADEGGRKYVSAVVIGMGLHGTEMVKALAWYGQMDGYQVEIHAFDKDNLAEEKFSALAPELMDSNYNGVYVDGEAQYKISIHSDMDVTAASFANTISSIKRASYVFISLGSDALNIETAVNVRMLFERIGLHPKIQAVVYNTQAVKALQDICNFRGQAYDINFIGDLESSFKKDVIIDSALEQDALQRHLKWGKEEDFWTYEYNYRSSMASAIHLKAKIACGIPGADKPEEALTTEERDGIERLEHRRWNAYMRAEGYVYSGSTAPDSRNDLAKMHHNLVDFSDLSEEDKRKDSRVGTV